MNKLVLPISLLSSLLLTGCSSKEKEEDPQKEPEMKEKIKVACIGDSLTYGHSWHNESYPVYLQNQLEEDYIVNNYGINGASITGYGGSWNNPSERYFKKAEYRSCLEFNPDYIFIMLGSNDTANWNSAREIFKRDYYELLDGIYENNEDVNIILMISPPVLENNGFGLAPNKIEDYLNPLQRQVADEYGLDTIDVHRAFKEHNNMDSLFRNDGVHLSVEGATLVASLISNYLK